MQPRLLIAIIFFVLPFISFSQAGTLDNSFGVNGKVLTRFKGLNSDAYSVLKQSDEKIITAGEYFDSLNINTGIALARYYPNGNLDSAFGISGLVTTKSFGDEDQPNSAALQSDGKIVVVANSFNNGYSNINLEVLRYSSTGKLDSSFGKNGRTIPNLGFYSSGYAIAIQSNGNILVSGVTADSGKYTEFLLVQFLINGDLDSSFGLNGFIRTSFENFATVGYSLALQSDGKIIVGGRTSDSISNKTLMSFFRFNKNGTPDSSFGINGKALIGSNESAEIKSVALQSDGKIVGGGNSYANNQGDYIIVRLKSNGKIDSSFGINGETITDIYGGYDKLKSIVINVDDKVIAAGYASVAPDYTQINFELVRYKSCGIIDSSFGFYGKQTMDFYSKDDNARSMLLQNDQKIVVAGYAEDTLVNFALARYNNDVVLAVNFTSFTATKIYNQFY